MEKKYELGKEKCFGGAKLRRVVALRDFGDVKKGDIGGWIESEHNLSHNGNCWVDDDARVSGNARVFGNALVSGKAKIEDGFVF